MICNHVGSGSIFFNGIGPDPVNLNPDRQLSFLHFSTGVRQKGSEPVIFINKELWGEIWFRVFNLIFLLHYEYWLRKNSFLFIFWSVCFLLSLTLKQEREQWKTGAEKRGREYEKGEEKERERKERKGSAKYICIKSKGKDRGKKKVWKRVILYIWKIKERRVSYLFSFLPLKSNLSYF